MHRQRWSVADSPEREFKQFRERARLAFVEFFIAVQGRQSRLDYRFHAVYGDVGDKDIKDLILASDSMHELADVLQQGFWTIQRVARAEGVDSRSVWSGEFCAGLLRRSVVQLTTPAPTKDNECKSAGPVASASTA